MFCWPSLQWCHQICLHHPVLPVHSMYIWKNGGGGVNNEMIETFREGWFWAIIYYWSRALPSHQLPHQPQGQGWDASVQVNSANAHNGEICCFAQIHSIVTVLQLVEGNSGGKRRRRCFFFSYWGTSGTALIYLLHVGSQFGVRWLVDLVPINGNFYLVIELKYDDGILQISRGQGCVLILLRQLLQGYVRLWVWEIRTNTDDQHVGSLPKSSSSSGMSFLLVSPLDRRASWNYYQISATATVHVNIHVELLHMV